jgi:hypothetical protein
VSSGTVTADGAEDLVYNPTITQDCYVEVVIFLNNMQAGDTTVIRVYSSPDGGATWQLEDSITYSGALTNKVFRVVSSYQNATLLHKTTLQQTGGTNRTYQWFGRTKF